MRTPSRRQILAAGLGVAAFAAAAASDAADLTPAEDANVALVKEFCAVWSTRDVTRALPFLADDCVYRMTERTPPVSGHDGVAARLKPALDDASLVEFRILDVKASGPIVITHRIDRFMTSRPFTWEGVGVFFLKDGRIKEWTDYTIRTER